MRERTNQGAPVVRPSYQRWFRSAPQPRFRGIPLVLAVLVVVTAVILPGETSPSYGAGSDPSGLAIQFAEKCNAIGSTAASALYITQPEPSQNLSAGGRITSYLEFQVINFTSADLSIQLHFPSTYFSYPLSSGTTFSVVLNPQFVNITGSGWLLPPSLIRSQVVSGPLDFVHNGSARVSTQKLAVMATGPYGTITVEFRWHWVMVQPGTHTHIRHSWSRPTYFSGKIGNLPSIFEPAPYVSYLGGTGASAVIGTNYLATLGGDVASRFIFLEMEYPTTGSVVESYGQIAPSGATSFNATIPLLDYDSSLAPGTYLIHVHDACGALLYNKSVAAVFAPTATVRFFVSPASCGNITVNGTQFANGSSASFVPSTTGYSFTIPGCAHYLLHSKMPTGAVTTAPMGHLLVSNNGSFWVFYDSKLPGARNYTVTFQASGLNPGTNWSVDLGGVHASTTGSVISFLDPNGTYPFKMGMPYGYVVSPAVGNVTVAGLSVTVSVAFTYGL